MSKAWHLHCKTCDSEPEDMQWNHGDRALSEVWRARAAILTVCESNADLEVRRFGYGLDTAWLREHGVHEVELRSEYGEAKALG